MTFRRADARPIGRPATSITIVGHVCIDENEGADGIVERLAGSPAVFMLRQYSRSGIDVGILAPYGSDFAEFTADIPLMNAAEHDTTLLYRNIFDGDERRQECLNADASEPVALDVSARARLASTDILVFSPLLPTFSAAYAAEVLRSVPADAVKVLLPQGYMRSLDAEHHITKRAFDEYAEILPLFDVVVFSDEDVDDALVRAEEWSRRFTGTRIVVTQNKRGATLFDRGSAAEFSSTPVTATDPLATIGAGDVFSATLALSYFYGHDLWLAVEDANGAAGRFVHGGHGHPAAAELDVSGSVAGG